MPRQAGIKSCAASLKKVSFTHWLGATHCMAVFFWMFDFRPYLPLGMAYLTSLINYPFRTF